MNHAQALKDYKKLVVIACGGSHDVSEFLEKIAQDLLEKPCKKLAKEQLVELIWRYFSVGDASGQSINNPEAIEIFRRYGFFRPDEKQVQES
jgi:hypothetical protein